MQESTSKCASQFVSIYACRVGLYIGTVWADVGFKKYLSKILRCSSVCGTSTRVHRQGVTHLTSDPDSRSLISLESHIEDMLTTDPWQIAKGLWGCVLPSLGRHTPWSLTRALRGHADRWLHLPIKVGYWLVRCNKVDLASAGDLTKLCMDPLWMAGHFYSNQWP